MAKYSPFGVAFSKAFLAHKGANPAFYVVNDALVPGPHLVKDAKGKVGLRRGGIKRGSLLNSFHREAMSLSTRLHDLMFDPLVSADMKDVFLRTDLLRQRFYTDVLAFVKDFRSREPEESRKNYYMEREWRIYGDVEFAPKDVTGIILPKGYKEAFKRRFPEHAHKVRVASASVSPPSRG